MAEELKFKVTKWQPGIIETNLDDVEKAVNESLKKYKGLVIQESDIPDMKKAKANMNSLSTEINKWRIQKEKEFMEPFQEKKDQCNRIVSTIKETSGEIDKQLKAYDQKEKEAKAAKIKEYWNEIKPKELEISLDQVWDDRYLLKGYTEKKWKKELDEKSANISKDLNAITNMIMSNKEQGSFVAEEYRKSLDLGSALTKWNEHMEEQQRLLQMQAEAKARREQQEAARKAAEEAIKARNEEVSRTVATSAEKPANEPQQAPVQADVKQILYWCEFRVEDASKEQLVQLMNAMNQIGIVPNKHWMETGSPAGKAHWHLISKGNSGGNEDAQK